MEPIRVADLARVLEGAPSPAADPDAAVLGVAIHSARIAPGAAFFALSGSHVDGHDFVDRALDNGAVAAVVSAAATGLDGRALIRVDDPLAALQRLAAWWRSRLRGRITAVVGSFGKTTTKDALVDLLGGATYGTHGSLNSRLGVPLAVLACPLDAPHAVIEVATADPGDGAALQGVVRPDNVIVTSAAARWQSAFGSAREEMDEMLALAGGLSTDGIVLLAEGCRTVAGATAAISGRDALVAGSGAGLPQFGESRWDLDGIALDVTFPGGERGTARIRTTSPAVAADIRLAATAAWLLGTPAAALLAALAEYTPTSARIELWRSVGGITLVRSAASADPDVTGQALRTARILAGAARRTLVVLAGDLEGLTPPAARALVQVLAEESIDELVGLDTETHRLIATELRRATGGERSRLFPGTAELRSHLVADLRHGDVVLVQSPPTRGIHDLATALSDAMAPTRLYFDVTALEENVRTFRRLVGPAVRLMGVVKAVAYGTDAVNVSLCLQESGIDMLAVSSADEGALLRRSGVVVPILVLLGTADEMEKMLRHGLMPLVYSRQVLEAVLDAAPGGSRPLPVHIEVDSGMHRAGFPPDEAVGVLRTLAAAPGVAVEGLMTHLSCADDPAEDAHTALQLRRFAQVCEQASALGMRGLIRHAAATAATIRLPDARLDMVRVGLGLYGLHPSPATRTMTTLVPVVGLVSRIVEILEVVEGERVGYGGTHTVPAGGGRVGVVPAGYHDGIPRAFSNHGHVVVHGVRCPMIGTLSMDSVTVDLSDCPDARVGSDVLIHGRHHDSLSSVEEAAARVGTIPHELLARLGPRVQRVFTRH